MFQFPGFAPHFGGVPESPPAGCPIRKSAARRVFAPDRGLSQLITSFLASESQGILHVPLSPFLRILVTTSCRLFLIHTRRSLVSMSFEFFIFSCLRYAFAVAYRRFQYVNVLFPVIVVPGRVELPTSTLSV